MSDKNFPTVGLTLIRHSLEMIHSLPNDVQLTKEG